MSLFDSLILLRGLWATVRQKHARAASRTGKGLLAQLREVFVLRFGPGKLSPEDYYLYQLFDDTQFSREQKRAFISERRLPDQFWARRSAVLADDKAVFFGHRCERDE